VLHIEEKAGIASARLRGLGCQHVEQSFERQLKKPAPTRAKIQLLVCKIKSTGSVLEEKCLGRPQISEHDVGRIQ
jgi:hypothetical protein